MRDPRPQTPADRRVVATARRTMTLRTVGARDRLRYPVRMSASPIAPRTPPSRLLWAGLLLSIGILGMSAFWVLLALLMDSQSAWVAVLTAADLALLLRLVKVAPGWPRATTCVIATVVVIAAANWGISAAHIGFGFGFGLLDSIPRLGMHHAMTLFGLANLGVEWAWYGIAAIVALWLGR